MIITVYSTTTCPYCKLLKDYFKEKGIVFTEKFIDQDDAAKSEMEKVSNGFLGVPFTIFIKDDGTTEGIIGFDKGKINGILNITG